MSQPGQSWSGRAYHRLELVRDKDNSVVEERTLAYGPVILLRQSSSSAPTGRSSTVVESRPQVARQDRGWRMPPATPRSCRDPSQAPCRATFVGGRCPRRHGTRPVVAPGGNGPSPGRRRRGGRTASRVGPVGPHPTTGPALTQGRRLASPDSRASIVCCAPSSVRLCWSIAKLWVGGCHFRGDHVSCVLDGFAVQMSMTNPHAHSRAAY